MKDDFKLVLEEVHEARRITKSAHQLIDKAHRLRSNSPEKKAYYKKFLEPLKSICTRIWDPFFLSGSISTIKDDDFGPDFRFKYFPELDLTVDLDWKLFVTTFCDPHWGESVPVDQYVSMSHKQFYKFKDEKPQEWVWIERNITSFDPETFAGNRNAQVFSFANLEQKESWGYGAFCGDSIQHWNFKEHYFHSQLINGSEENVVVFRFDSLPIQKDFTELIPLAREKGVLF